MKVNLKGLYGIYSWEWDVPEDELCGICRVPFDGTCPMCKYPGDQCPIVVGECHHAFHLHCIWKWLETDTSKGLCPMCRQPFQTDKKLPVNQGIDITAASCGNLVNRSSESLNMDDIEGTSDTTSSSSTLDDDSS